MPGLYRHRRDRIGSSVSQARFSVGISQTSNGIQARAWSYKERATCEQWTNKMAGDWNCDVILSFRILAEADGCKARTSGLDRCSVMWTLKLALAEAVPWARSARL